jgi:hypothetical protein
MGLSITFSNGTYIIDDGIKKLRFPSQHVEISVSGDDVILSPIGESTRGKVVRSNYTNFTSPSGASSEDVAAAILDLNTSILSTRVEPNKSIPVTLQDQTTPLVVTKFSYLQNSTVTTADVSIGDTLITVSDTTAISAGKLLTIFSPTSLRYTQVGVIGIAGSNVTIDSPIDFAYTSGSIVDVQEPNLATLSGSLASPVICGVRNNAGGTPPPGIELTLDVTRLILKCFTATAPTLSDFGDIALGLTNGLVLRKRDGNYYNIFNIKTNGQVAGMMFDFDILTAAGGGQDGFKARLTFGGQDKFGSVIRLPINEDLELVIQDNLTTLQSFEIIAEGSIVQD